jgi:cysteine desulfuration protein SufE
MPQTKLSQFLDTLRALEPDMLAEVLIEYAGRFHSVPADVAVRPFAAENRVPGCESEVYVWAKPQSEGLKFYFAVENPQGISAKALAVVLDESLSGQPLEVVQSTPPEIVHQLFGKTLSMGKGQGLMGMVNAVRSLARSHPPH